MNKENDDSHQRHNRAAPFSSDSDSQTPLISSPSRRRRTHRQRLPARLTAALLLLLCLLSMGCYRSATMNMTPLLQPWRGTQADRGQTLSRPKVSVLTPKDLVHHVLHHNLRLRWLRNQATLMLQNAQGYYAVNNPEFRVMGLSGALADGKLDQLGVRLRWSPPFPTVDAAAQDRETALALADGQQLWLETYQQLAQARQLYVQLLTLARQEQRMQKLLVLKRKRWEWEQTRSKAGIATKLQVATQHMAYIQTHTNLQQLRIQSQTLRLQLQQQLGVEGACRLVPPANFDKPKAQPGRRVRILQAIKHSPGLAIIRHRYRAHKAALWIETTKRIPWLSFVQMSYEFGSSPWPYGFFLGFGVELPLFNWNTFKINQQKRIIEALKVQARIQVGQIVQQVTTSYARWKLAKQQMLHSQKTLQAYIQQSRQLLQSTTQQVGVQLLERWRLATSILQLQGHLTQQIERFHLASIQLDQYSYAPVWKRFGLSPPKTNKR